MHEISKLRNDNTEIKKKLTIIDEMKKENTEIKKENTEMRKELNDPKEINKEKDLIFIDEKKKENELTNNKNTKLRNELNETKEIKKEIKKENTEKRNELNELEEISYKEIEEYEFLKKINFKKDSTEVYIDNLLFNKDNLRQLNIGLKLNQNIEELFLSRNNLGENTEALDEILLSIQKYCKKLNWIAFYHQNLGSNPKDINKICNTLSQLNNLKTFSLWNNNLGSNLDNMKIISDFLKNNKTIEYLGLGDNSLGLNSKENLKLLFEGLKDNKTMKTLDLNYNNFTEYDENFKLLAENTSLKAIYLYGNKFNKEAKEEFRKINLNEKTKNIFEY